MLITLLMDDGLGIWSERMSFKATVIKVMIASPGDVTSEREAIREGLAGWNYINAEDRKLVLMPIGWDTHASPRMGERPQAIINKQVLADCDLLVAVFWTRLGSPTGEAASGTVEEIEEHLKAGKPAMIYFSDAPIRPGNVNKEQYRALKKFKEECYRRGLVEPFDSLQQLRDKFSRQLAQTIIREFAISSERPSEVFMQADRSLTQQTRDSQSVDVGAKEIAEEAITAAMPTGLVIKSPMVGTIYLSEAPDSPPFVNVGSTVHADTTVCIIESMKIFTYINSGINGTIAEILVKNSQIVEFEQPLFRLVP